MKNKNSSLRLIKAWSRCIRLKEWTVEFYPRALRELAGGLAIALCIIFEKSQGTNEEPDKWIRTNVFTMVEKDWKHYRF